MATTATRRSGTKLSGRYAGEDGTPAARSRVQSVLRQPRGHAVPSSGWLPTERTLWEESRFLRGVDLPAVARTANKWRVAMTRKPTLLPVCPVCGGHQSTAVYRVEAAPVTCGSIFATPEEAKAVACGTIELHVCDSCGFVFNRTFDPALARIGAKYESSQAASAHFSAYARSLAFDWVKRLGLTGKTVLEIGCGRGEFLFELLRVGAGKAIGLDPLVGRPRIAAEVEDRLQLIAAAFDDDQIDIEADAVVCRHTLEHIWDVDGFLQLLARWARRNPDRVVLFEVPASERIFSECAFWDIYYEHCSYFTRASLSYAFAHAGFDVQSVVLAYDDQYLLLEARAAKSRAIAAAPRDVAAVRNSALVFGDRARHAIEQARRSMRALAQQGRLVIWQGAAKTVGFLTAIADPTSAVCAIDVNPQRHDMYLPGLGLEVTSPDKLKVLKPRNVVLMNPVYYAEVKSSLLATGSDARLFTVNQVCEGLESEVGE